MKRLLAFIFCSVVVYVVLTGCSQTANNNNKPNDSGTDPDPITLRAYPYSGALGKEDFEQYISGPVKQKFPHITLEYAVVNEGTVPAELIATDSMPDIIMMGMRALTTFQELKAVVDLRDLAKKNQLDLSKYRQEAIEGITSFGSKDELFALPFYVNFHMMAYNKDIFDKFAVDYPRDAMTWDEVLEYATLLTREDGGISYKGMQPADTVDTFGLALGLSFINPNTGKAEVTTEGWRKVFDYANRFNSIPGNQPKDLFNMWQGANDFMQDKNIAMMPWFGSRLQQLVRANDELGFDWDIVSYPSFKESPGIAAELDMHIFALSSMSKHQEETFKVLQYLTASEDLQGEFVKLGRALPSIQSDHLMAQFGSAYPVLQDKNLEGVFKSVSRQAHQAHKYDDLVRGKIRAAFASHLNEGVDVNTALRQAEEEANKDIEARDKE